MKKNKLTLIASLVLMLAALFAVPTVFSVKAEAATYEAAWGTDAENLPANGTLQEAFDAAAANPTVSYISVGTTPRYTSALNITGGSFTLDLAGGSIISDGHALSIKNGTELRITDTVGGGLIEALGSGTIAICTDESAVKLTVDGDLTVKGTNYAVSLGPTTEETSGAEFTLVSGSLVSEQYALLMKGKTAIVKGGSLTSAAGRTICLNHGTLDLSQYPDPSGITLLSFSAADISLPSTSLLIPEGYAFFENGAKVSNIASSTSGEIHTYTIDLIKYAVSVSTDENGSLTLSPELPKYAPGTTVTVTVQPSDGYMLGELQVTGAASFDDEAGSFVVGNEDITVFATFKLHQADWGTDAEHLTESGTLQEAFDAAALDASITYIRLVNDIQSSVEHSVTNGSFTLDLAGKALASNNGYTLRINGDTELLITDTVGGGSIVTTIEGSHAIYCNDDATASITVDGNLTIRGTNGAILMSLTTGGHSETELTVRGGTLRGSAEGSTAIYATGKRVTLLGGTLSSLRENIRWQSGTLDFSQHPDPSGITLTNYTGGGVALPSASLFLPESYAFYDADNTVETLSEYATIYTVNEILYGVELDATEGGTATLSPSGTAFSYGTTVTLTVTPDENHWYDVEVIGATYDPETQSFTVGTSEITVKVTFKPRHAIWGADKDNLTEQGTLAEALASVPTGGYVQLVSRVEVDRTPTVTDGKVLTLDLCGYTIESTRYALFVLEGTTVTLIDSAGGGKLIGGEFALMVEGDITVKGGAFEAMMAQVMLIAGRLDLSQHADPAGISVLNNTTNTISLPSEQVLLPESYSFYDNNYGIKTTQLLNTGIYAVDKTRYEVSVNAASGISVNPDPSGSRILPGTRIYIDLTLAEHFALVSLTVNDGAVTVSEDATSGRLFFVMPESDVSIIATAKHVAFAWGESSTALTESGSLAELVAAINAGNAPYAKALDNCFDILSSQAKISGKSVIDLNGHSFNLGGNPGFALESGADLTFFSSEEKDAFYINNKLMGYVVTYEGAKLTLDGAYAEDLEIYYAGGAIDIGKAHLSSRINFWNYTDGALAPSDAIVFGERFAALKADDPILYESTLPRAESLEDGEAARIYAIFKISFDFGAGSGRMPAIETILGTRFHIPMATEVSHPDGLSIVGWKYTLGDFELQTITEAVLSAPQDLTLTAVWDEAIHIGKVVMRDGDYLASGATETTRSRPFTGGYAYYEDGVLTLNDFTLTEIGHLINRQQIIDDTYDLHAQIFSAGDLTLELIGESHISVDRELLPSAYTYANSICVAGTLTVRGTGRLIAVTDNTCLEAGGITVESGELMLSAPRGIAISTENLTVNGGKMTVSSAGIDAFVYTQNGGEVYMTDDGTSGIGYGLQAKTFVMNDGKLILKQFSGISAHYITVSGGVIEVESYTQAIRVGEYSPFEVSSDKFLLINGGRVTVKADSAALQLYGKLTVTGGSLICTADFPIQAYALDLLGGSVSVYGNQMGIVLIGDGMTVSGGELYVSGVMPIHLTDEDGTVSITGGLTHLYGVSGGILAESTVTVSGGTVIIESGDNPVTASVFTVSGDRTLLVTTAAPGEAATVNEEELRLLVESTDLTVYCGKALTHAFGTEYFYDATHHFRICTDEACAFRVLYEVNGIDLHQYCAEAAYAEHTLTDGSCICGYEESTPSLPLLPDSILAVGDKQLGDGQYLDGEGNISTEKPEGGYLHVALLDDTVARITLKDFTFTYAGAVLMKLDNAYLWELVLEGKNELTVLYDTHRVDDHDGGIAILVERSALLIDGLGELTLNANLGIGARDASIYHQARLLTVNARQTGIFIECSDFTAYETVFKGDLVICTEEGNGIESFGTSVSFYFGSTSITAGNDGIYIFAGMLTVEAARSMTVDAGDDGIVLNNASGSLASTGITILAGDDGIDADIAEIQLENLVLKIESADHGMDLGSCYLDGVNLSLAIHAGDDGIDAAECGIFLEMSDILIEAKDYALDLDMEDEYGEGIVFMDSTLRLFSESNYVSDTTVRFLGCEVHIEAETVGFFTESVAQSVITFDLSNASILAGESGFLANNDTTANISQSKLLVSASFRGFDGEVTVSLTGSSSLEVSALQAFHCNEILVGTPGTDEQNSYIMNAKLIGYTFLKENGDVADYVTVISHARALESITETANRLEQLLGESGEIDLITETMADLNRQLSAAETAYTAEDASIRDALAQARGTLESAIAALGTRLDSTKTELEGKIDEAHTAIDQANAANQALRGELEAAETALKKADKRTNTTVVITIVIASVSFACNAGIGTAAIILERKKKLISSLFRGVSASNGAPAEAAPDADAGGSEE